MSAKLDQLEEDANTLARRLRRRLGSLAAAVLAESGASVDPGARRHLRPPAASTSSADPRRLGHDLVARRRARSDRAARPSRPACRRAGRSSGRPRVRRGGDPVEPDGLVSSSATRSPTRSPAVHFVERQLLVAGLIGLLFAARASATCSPSVHARRIARLERAAERIAAGQLDEPVVDTGHDELGQLAAAFERMRVRLENLDRARSEFIANASHELRTPLFSLGGFLELMADEELDEKTRREFLETMREQVDRLAKLATDLLDLSRLDAGRMQRRARAGRSRRGRAGGRGGVPRRRRAAGPSGRGRGRRPADRARGRAARAPGLPGAARQRARAHPGGDAGDAAGATPTASTPISRSRTKGRACRRCTRRTSSTASTAPRAASPPAAGSGSRSRGSWSR